MNADERWRGAEDEFDGERFEGGSLDGEALEKRWFTGCTFVRCTFVEAAFRRCVFVDCTFVGCDLTAMKPQESRFQRVRFEGCKMMGVDWSGADRLAFEVAFEDSQITYSSFFGVQARDLTVVGCKAHDVDFTEADLRGARFDGTALDGSLFRRTNLTGVSLEHASGYAIHPADNTLADTRMSVEGALAAVEALGVVVAGLGEAPEG